MHIIFTILEIKFKEIRNVLNHKIVLLKHPDIERRTDRQTECINTFPLSFKVSKLLNSFQC